MVECGTIDLAALDEVIPEMNQKVPELRAADFSQSFVVCGPPGSGKLFALRQAMPPKTGFYDLGHIASESGVRQPQFESLINQYGSHNSSVDSQGRPYKRLLVLTGAECMTKAAVDYLHKRPHVLVFQRTAPDAEAPPDDLVQQGQGQAHGEVLEGEVPGRQ